MGKWIHKNLICNRFFTLQWLAVSALFVNLTTRNKSCRLVVYRLVNQTLFWNIYYNWFNGFNVAFENWTMKYESHFFKIVTFGETCYYCLQNRGHRFWVFCTFKNYLTYNIKLYQTIPKNYKMKPNYTKSNQTLNYQSQIVSNSNGNKIKWHQVQIVPKGTKILFWKYCKPPSKYFCKQMYKLQKDHIVE